MPPGVSVTQFNQLSGRVNTLETRFTEVMAIAQDILALANDANAQLDAIAAKLAGQISPAEATAIRDSLAALVTKATQLAQ